MTRRTAILALALVVVGTVGAWFFLRSRTGPPGRGEPRTGVESRAHGESASTSRPVSDFLKSSPEEVPTRAEVLAEATRAQDAAIVRLEPMARSGVRGSAILMEMASGGTQIEIKLEGLDGQTHGLHVLDATSCDFDAMKPPKHLNPDGVLHGYPAASSAHVGDLGNVTSDERGLAVARLSSRRMALREGPASVVAKILVVTARPDDLRTDPDGRSGAVIACGRIERD